MTGTARPDTRLALDTRAGLPEALQVLLRDYPRDLWTSHRNFDGLTRFWLERHAMFRQLLERLQADGQGFLDRRIDAATHARQTRRLAGFLLNELHGHHQIEDVQYFPILSGLERRLSAGFDLLDADHHALDGHLHALADSTNALLQAIAEGGLPSRSIDAAGRLQTALDGFAPFLDRHLIDEEELVVPVLLHHAPRF
jgi:hypothetical protein